MNAKFGMSFSDKMYIVKKKVQKSRRIKRGILFNSSFDSMKNCFGKKANKQNKLEARHICQLTRRICWFFIEYEFFLYATICIDLLQEFNQCHWVSEKNLRHFYYVDIYSTTFADWFDIRFVVLRKKANCYLLHRNIAAAAPSSHRHHSRDWWHSILFSFRFKVD